jgi:TrmH family RNA methyltransferase
MGAIGRVKVHYTDLPTLLATIKDKAPLYGTFLDGKDIYQKELKTKV